VRKQRTNKPRIGEGKDDATVRRLPVLVAADLSDHSCLATADAVVDRSLPASPAIRRGIRLISKGSAANETVGGPQKELTCGVRGRGERGWEEGAEQECGSQERHSPWRRHSNHLFTCSASGLTE
jgi:hypothetical protein